MTLARLAPGLLAKLWPDGTFTRKMRQASPSAPHVPHKSLDQVHAISMPGAAQTVNRLPLGLSCRPPSIRSFDAVSDISTPQQWFAYAHLLDPYLTRSSPCLSLNAHHNGSLPMQLKVVSSLLLQADSEGPTLIFCAVTRTLY